MSLEHIASHRRDLHLLQVKNVLSRAQNSSSNRSDRSCLAGKQVCPMKCVVTPLTSNCYQIALIVIELMLNSCKLPFINKWRNEKSVVKTGSVSFWKSFFLNIMCVGTHTSVFVCFLKSVHPFLLSRRSDHSVFSVRSQTGPRGFPLGPMVLTLPSVPGKGWERTSKQSLRWSNEDGGGSLN